MTMTRDAWADAKAVIGSTRVTLGPQASHQLLNDPSHYCMVLARYRVAAALIGDAETVLEAGAGECLGAGILARGRHQYVGIDTDEEALTIAADMYAGRPEMTLHAVSAIDATWTQAFDAVVSLDVAEHVPPDQEEAFFENLCRALTSHGRLVIGTPNAAFDHLASPQSKAGHINTYTHDRLHALMSRYFRVVQSFGMNDVALHTGHPEARHYLIAVGISPR